MYKCIWQLVQLKLLLFYYESSLCEIVMRNLFSAKNTKTLKQETHIIRPDKEFPNALKLRYIRKHNNIVDMVYVHILKCIAR